MLSISWLVKILAKDAVGTSVHLEGSPHLILDNASQNVPINLTNLFKYRCVGIKNPPLSSLSTNFWSNVSLSSYCLEISSKSVPSSYFFWKYLPKNFACGANFKFLIILSAIPFTLYTGPKTCKTGSKIFACGAKFITF